MIHALSPRLQRALALTLLLLAVFAVWGGVVTPIARAWQERTAAIESDRQLLAGYRRATSDPTALLERLKQAEQILVDQRGFLEGPTEALAAARLQGDLKRIVEAAGGQLRSAQSLAPVAEEGNQRIGVRIDTLLNIETLKNVLHAIEGAIPPLFIAALEIQAPEEGQNAPGRAIPLTTRMEIHGYLQGGQ